MTKNQTHRRKKKQLSLSRKTKAVRKERKSWKEIQKNRKEGIQQLKKHSKLPNQTLDKKEKKRRRKYKVFKTQEKVKKKLHRKIRSYSRLVFGKSKCWKLLISCYLYLQMVGSGQSVRVDARIRSPLAVLVASRRSCRPPELPQSNCQRNKIFRAGDIHMDAAVFKTQ